MSAHLIEAWPKTADRAGRGELPSMPAAASPAPPDPAAPPTGLHPTPRPDPVTGPEPITRQGPVAGSLPHWRALLEARWQARLRQITELSLTYHEAAAVGGTHQPGDRAAAARLRNVLRRTVATRRALADIEEALARLGSGRFGRCEQCDDAIPAARLALIPETRYCPACATPLTRDTAPGRDPVDAA